MRALQPSLRPRLRPPPPRRRAVAAAAASPAAATHAPAVADFASHLAAAQASLLDSLEALDGSGARFRRDEWSRGAHEANPGRGLTAVLEGGALIEKGAASTTFIQGGVLSPERAAALTSRGVTGANPGSLYSASALSIVLHPANPHVPTLRGDVRAFAVGGEVWYGGGADLTPAYLYEDDAASFHSYWRHACDRHSPALYPELKAACDAYFWIPARREHRGVGGIFFDGGAGGSKEDPSSAPSSSPSSLSSVDGRALAEDVAAGWLPSWEPVVARRRALPATARERDWQLLRRGRYVEFNLLYDRGVRFGLDGGGRAEAVMVSAPPLVRWGYDVVPEPGSREAALVDALRTPREWA
jgi:coproporphyrinogen III oxidase